MALYSEFNRDITTSVPGCPDILIDREVKRAVVDFFRRSDVWEVAIVGTANVGDTPSSVVTVTAGVALGTRLKKISYLQYLAIPLCSLSDDQFVVEYSEYRDNSPTGTPQHYTLIEEDILHVMPAPLGLANATAFQGRGILVPTDDNTEIPDKYYEQYEEAIVARVLARLMSIPQQHWTNLPASRDYLGLYELKLGEIRNELKRRESRILITSIGNGYGG